MTKQTEALTDSQCDEFRRLPMSFNDMVRAIYKAGQEALEKPTTEQSSLVQEPVGYVVSDYEECCKEFNGKTLMSKEKTDLHKIPLYTTPPSRECNCKDKK